MSDKGFINLKNFKSLALFCCRGFPDQKVKYMYDIIHNLDTSKKEKKTTIQNKKLRLVLKCQIFNAVFFSTMFGGEFSDELQPEAFKKKYGIGKKAEPL